VLKATLDTLKGLRPKFFDAQTVRNLDEIGVEVKKRYLGLKATKIAQPTQEVKTEEKTAKKHTYSIALEDLEVLSALDVEAYNENEAKEIFVERLRQHLMMVDLKIKG